MDVRQFIEEHAAEFFGSLSDWLAIPSISKPTPGKPRGSSAGQRTGSGLS